MHELPNLQTLEQKELTMTHIRYNGHDYFDSVSSLLRLLKNFEENEEENFDLRKRVKAKRLDVEIRAIEKVRESNLIDAFHVSCSSRGNGNQAASLARDTHNQVLRDGYYLIVEEILKGRVVIAYNFHGVN